MFIVYVSILVFSLMLMKKGRLYVAVGEILAVHVRTEPLLYVAVGEILAVHVRTEPLLYVAVGEILAVHVRTEPLLYVAVGEILAVHVKTEPMDKEYGIHAELRKLLSMTKQFDKMSVEDRSRVDNLLCQLQAVFVGASLTGSILFYVHLETSTILQSVRGMHESGQLTGMIRDLFRCLAKDNSLSVEVEISAELFQQCEDGFSDDGKFRFYGTAF